ncbi:hypothetical protein, partial [Ralstonia pseudosolanacearum]|uniref:hypothetical protein n=1 Tax=Ralstonia pseudosolanacearum TaxID=1310165 RepID=UPI003221458C
ALGERADHDGAAVGHVHRPSPVVVRPSRHARLRVAQAGSRAGSPGARGMQSDMAVNMSVDRIDEPPS